jgi:hypothetical protein
MSGAAGHVDPSHKGIALLIATLALVLAFSETLGKAAQTSGLSYNIEASNLWNFYQAKTVRMTTLRTAAEAATLQAGSATPEAVKAQAEAWRKTAARYDSEPETGEGRKELMARAKSAEAKRDRAMAAYHQYEGRQRRGANRHRAGQRDDHHRNNALAQVSRRAGCAGCNLSLIGFLAPTAVHLF